MLCPIFVRVSVHVVQKYKMKLYGVVKILALTVEPDY